MSGIRLATEVSMIVANFFTILCTATIIIFKAGQTEFTVIYFWRDMVYTIITVGLLDFLTTIFMETVLPVIVGHGEPELRPSYQGRNIVMSFHTKIARKKPNSPTILNSKFKTIFCMIQ